jgi:hypothetical protein
MRLCKRTDAAVGITAKANRLDNIIDPGIDIPDIRPPDRTDS